jgi:putative nucleotidyltransferase with HDIG domain
MGARYVPVNECRVGDVIARDVINPRGSVLVTKNSTITQYIKDRLLEKEYESVWIFTRVNSDFEVRSQKYEDFSRSYDEMVFSVKELFKGLSVGESLDIGKVFRLGKTLFGNLEESGIVVQYLLNTIEKSDEYTYSHSVNVALYSLLIAKWLELPETWIKEITIAGLLHDIGKVLIPKEILNKKNKLTENEFAIMKYHTVVGYESIKDIPHLEMSVKEAVLYHHERLNGSGYPQGIGGDDLSLYTRIVSIADVYDAMTQNRIYKKKRNPFEVFKFFSTEGLGIFDIEIVEVFLKNIAGLLIGLNVILDNNKVGEIVYIPPHNITRPMVKLGSTVIDSTQLNLRIESVI